MPFKRGFCALYSVWFINLHELICIKLGNFVFEWEICWTSAVKIQMGVYFMGLDRCRNRFLSFLNENFNFVWICFGNRIICFRIWGFWYSISIDSERKPIFTKFQLKLSLETKSISPKRTFKFYEKKFTLKICFIVFP